MSEEKPVIVIGDGWAALAAVGYLATEGTPESRTPIRWIAGSGAKILAPLPTLEAAQGSVAAQVILTLAGRLGIEAGKSESGSYLREFRNKAFREPAWTQAPTPETRAEVRDELLWAPERRFVNLFETRFNLTLGELEEEIRSRLTGNLFPNIRRIEGGMLAGVEAEHGHLKAITLASGERIEANRVIFADRWDLLSDIQGLPKGLAFTKRREPHGIIQATFTHETPVGLDLKEGFFAPMHKDAGEEMQRHVWGYFSSDGKRSFWSVCLSAEEVEDNHEIGKKLRKMKTTLDRVFTGTSWVPEGKADFMSNLSAVGGEQVRFEAAFVYSAGEALRVPAHLKEISGLEFLTDGYGPSFSFEQVAALLAPVDGQGLARAPVESEPQAEDENLSDAGGP